jgi:hypothetical protein
MDGKRAGVLTNPTTIANGAHLLANYLQVQPSQEVTEKSRQHFDLLLNIHRPKSNCILARSPFELPKLPESRKLHNGGTFVRTNR